MPAFVTPPSPAPLPFFSSRRRADRIGDGKLLCARIGFSEYADKEECKLPGELLAHLKTDRAETLNGASLPRSFKAMEGAFHQGRPQEQDNKLSRSLRTLILDNYDSYTYNLFQLLSVVNGVAPVVLKNDQLSFRELQRILYQFDNVVISPGPGSPDRSSDIGVCMRLLQECQDIPILGVCMGHQALGYAHGMRIMHAPEPVHGRLSAIQHTHHPLFRDIPSGSGFKVVRYHSLILDSTSLPSSLIPTAWTLSEKPVSCGRAAEERRSLSKTDDNTETLSSNSLLMGISHRTWPHHGVQFHPESIATVHGRKLLENFAKITRCFLRENPSRVRATNGTLKRNPDTNPDTFKPAERVALRLCFKKLQSLETSVGGSENIFRVVCGRNSVEDTFWLDSATADKNRCRFSFMGGKGGSLWQKITYCLSNDSSQGVLRVEDVNGDVCEKKLYDGFFDFMNKETQRYSCRREDYEQLPFGFVGGFVGYLGYELKCECGSSPNRHKSSQPDAAFFKADRFISIDHLTGDVYTVAVHEGTKESTGAAQSWVEQTADRIAGLSSTKCEKKYAEYPNNETTTENFTLSRTKDEYMDDVARCLKYIADGESYEVCLTAQMKEKTRVRDPFELYSVLRRTNPAPYASWLHFGNEGPCVCSSSPERFLQLDRTGTLEAKPIKGTVPRGKSSLEDEMLRSQLQESEKDQAENLMIVDLLRNDLGRVCIAGSVHVPHLMAVETYSTVHTLVSTVRGKKRADVTPIDCVKAAFPGGSMTGAPKLRTMEILDAVETCPRGVYSGAIGFFSFSSPFDLSIVIRTLVIQGGEISVGAGGAIVALSDPESEYEEMLLKTRAPTRAVKIASEERL